METNTPRPPQKRYSSTDVAKRAGVSRATVSYVLNGRRNATVPDATRARVLRAAEELGYKPNTLAQGLRRGTTTLIGVYTRLREDSFHDRIMHGIHQACDSRKHNVLAAYLRDDDTITSESFHRILEYQVRGLIRIIGSLTPEESARLQEFDAEHGISIVLVDDRANAGQFDCVVTDDFEGTRAVVDYLLGLGHRRIAHISGGDFRSTAPDRLDGYCRALTAAGIKVDDTLIQHSRYDAKSVEDQIAALIALPDRPTALFAANDRLAALAARSLQACGLRIPDDISLVGYGDTEIAVYTGLTSVNQDPEELGRRAVERLFERFNSPDAPPQTVSLSPRLVVRDSARRVSPLD